MKPLPDLSAAREAILDEWRRRLFDTYPAPTAGFLRRGRDRFRNPAAEILHRGTEEGIEALLGGATRPELEKALDGIVRLRAVQDFRPSDALAFVMELKASARVALGGAVASAADELAEFDRRVDDLALVSFDLYARCREQIMEIRLSESRAKVFKLLERAEAAGPRNAGGE